MATYVIANTTDCTYWSNAHGWTGRGEADRFSDRERRGLQLPVDGTWVTDDAPPLPRMPHDELLFVAEGLLSALRELTLRTRQFIAGDLVTFPAALLPQCEAAIRAAGAEPLDASE